MKDLYEDKSYTAWTAIQEVLLVTMTEDSYTRHIVCADNLVVWLSVENYTRLNHVDGKGWKLYPTTNQALLLC